MNTCPVCDKPDPHGVHYSCYAIMLAEYPELREIARKLYHGNLTGAQASVKKFYERKSQYDPSDNDLVEEE